MAYRAQNHAMKPALALIAALALAGAAHAVDVYKWTDSKGVVHYGDRPASGAAAATVNVQGGGNSPEEIEAAQASLEAAREKLDEPVPTERHRYYASRGIRQKPAQGSCAAAWSQYDAAQACFNRHRVISGKGVTDSGTLACREMPQPSCAR